MKYCSECTVCNALRNALVCFDFHWHPCNALSVYQRLLPSKGAYRCIAVGRNKCLLSRYRTSIGLLLRVRVLVRSSFLLEWHMHGAASVDFLLPIVRQHRLQPTLWRCRSISLAPSCLVASILTLRERCHQGTCCHRVVRVIGGMLRQRMALRHDRQGSRRIFPSGRQAAQELGEERKAKYIIRLTVWHGPKHLRKPTTVPVGSLLFSDAITKLRFYYDVCQGETMIDEIMKVETTTPTAATPPQPSATQPASVPVAASASASAAPPAPNHDNSAPARPPKRTRLAAQSTATTDTTVTPP